MAFNTKEFKTRTQEIHDWLQREFSTVRTGRATPALLDAVQVESYGARVPLNQVGSIGLEDARTLRVSCWDASQIQSVEKAITEADLGVSVAVDESGLRVIFPELTAERRSQMLKIAKTKYEDARVSLRAARDDAMKDIDSAQKSGELSEDAKFAAKEEIEEQMKHTNKELDTLLSLKEKEISE